MNPSADESASTSRKTRPARKTLAFTLVEMLVVMAVIILMLGVTVPLFKGMLYGRGVEKGINSATGLIELARANAIANQTYVWVLFKNVTNSDNVSELQCAAVMSSNGLNIYSPTSNFKAITGLIKIPNIQNVSYEDLTPALKNIMPADLSSGVFLVDFYTYAAGKSGFPSVVVSGQNFQDAPFFCFKSDGEIGTSGDTYDMLIQSKVCLALVETRGTTVQTSARDGAIITVYGGSARTRINRP